MNDSTLLAYARIGAAARLRELLTEADAIRAQFPDVDPSPVRTPPQGAVSGPPPRATADDRAPRQRAARKPMTAAQRAAVGRRMRAYWKARRTSK